VVAHTRIRREAWPCRLGPQPRLTPCDRNAEPSAISELFVFDLCATADPLLISQVVQRVRDAEAGTLMIP
jgi:hypothetical protein